MRDNRKNVLFVMLITATLLFASTIVLLRSDDSHALDPYPVYTYRQLKDALESKPSSGYIAVSDNITIEDDSITIDSDVSLTIAVSSTLTVPDGTTVFNKGQIVVVGTLEFNGTLVQTGNKIKQINVQGGNLTGRGMMLKLILPDFEKTSCGSNVFTFPYQTGVDDNTVNITCTTYSSDPGTYEYDRSQGPGKYYLTISPNGSLPYSPNLYSAGTFTILSSDSFVTDELVTDFGQLKAFLDGEPGVASITQGFAVTEDIAIKEGYTVSISPNVTLTIAEGATVDNGSRVLNNGTLSIEGTFLQHYGRSCELVDLGTINGRISLAVSDIDTGSRGENVFDISYVTGVNGDIVTLRCTTYSADAGTYTYSDTLGAGKYTIKVMDDAQHQYRVGSAGTFTIEKYSSVSVPQDDSGKDIRNILIAVIIVIAVMMLGTFLVSKR